MNEIDKVEKIENMIYEIRGKQVMLDSTLAKLYECKNGTKVINQAVNRNIERFPSDFYFQLTTEEVSHLKSQFVTSSLSNNYGGNRKLPYVFTEQGVAMLATIIRTRVAAQMSVKIMRAFVAMRHYIGNNEYRLSNIETKVLEHDKDIKLLQTAFKKFEVKKEINEIYFNNQIYDAYSKIVDIFNEAKEELIIIDRYTDKSLLDIIKKLKCEVKLITSARSKITTLDLNKYNSQYHNLNVYYNDTFHDRYFILDKEIIYNSGTSINYAGIKTFGINLIVDIPMKEVLINHIETIINK